MSVFTVDLENQPGSLPACARRWPTYVPPSTAVKVWPLEAQLTDCRAPVGQNARKPPRHDPEPLGGPGLVS